MTNVEKIMHYFNVDEETAKSLDEKGIDIETVKNKFISRIKDELSGISGEFEKELNNLEKEIT